MSPTDAVLAITYRCNAKCQMCDIWKNKVHTTELEPESYARLPRSLRNINISGGEPFLHQKIVEIIKIIHKTCPKARQVISTNGYATELILDRMKEIQKIYPKVAVRVSIDGACEVHNRLRGRSDFFERAIKTIKELKELGVDDLGISYTASDENLDQILDVYKLASEMNIVYTFCGVAHGSNIDNYFVKGNTVIQKLGQLEDSLSFLINSEIKKWQLNKLARAYYLSGVYKHAVSGQRKIFCGALDILFFMDPHGNVCSCNVLGEKLFNIKDKKFNEAWFSKEAALIREKVARCPRPCWMLCTVSPFIKNKPFPALRWILFNKIKSLLGFRVKVK